MKILGKWYRLPPFCVDTRALRNKSVDIFTKLKQSVLDEDDMASNSDRALATQQSIKVYVDNNAVGPEMFVSSETPSGSINGGNLVFYTAYDFEDGTLQVYYNGLRMKPGSGNDYQEHASDDNRFDFESGAAPVTGSNLIVDYIKKTV